MTICHFLKNLYPFLIMKMSSGFIVSWANGFLISQKPKEIHKLNVKNTKTEWSWRLTEALWFFLVVSSWVKRTISAIGTAWFRVGFFTSTVRCSLGNHAKHLAFHSEIFLRSVKRKWAWYAHDNLGLFYLSLRLLSPAI